MISSNVNSICFFKQTETTITFNNPHKYRITQFRLNHKLMNWKRANELTMTIRQYQIQESRKQRKPQPKDQQDTLYLPSVQSRINMKNLPQEKQVYPLFHPSRISCFAVSSLLIPTQLHIYTRIYRHGMNKHVRENEMNVLHFGRTYYCNPQ